MLNTLFQYLVRPVIYTPSTTEFWNHPHISKGMLEAHLDKNWDEASRKEDFINESVNWISTMLPSNRYPDLLDIGCGPGLYAEKFHSAGYLVTGVDFSQRSIAYAQEQSILNRSNIQYLYQNYLDMNYSESFDIVTLIYCDYGVLSTRDRSLLLDKIYKTLKPNGKLILDVFTPRQHEGKNEQKEWENNISGGFWDENPHLCLNSFYRYDEDLTVLNQTIVVSEHSTLCYNIWEHCFTEHTLINEIQNAGFGQIELFADVAGKPLNNEGTNLCAVITK